MKTCLSFVVVALLGIFAAPARGQDTYTLFLTKASVTVTKITTDADFFFTSSSKTLATNDLVNLALGRPLGTKVTEKLALAVFVEGPGLVAAPKTSLIVCDADVTARLATVATLSDLDYEAITTPGSGSKGQGIGAVQIVETTTGVDPVKNKFFASTLRGAAQGKATASTTPGELTAFAIAGTGLSGPLRVKFTTTRSTSQMEFDGIVTKGTVSTSKRLGTLRF